MDSIVFVGVGVSTAVPLMGHLHPHPERGDTCPVCTDALNPHSKNRRNNVSLLVRLAAGSGVKSKNLLFDCGKTFRDAYLTTLYDRGIDHFDALFLTHDHADAIMGLDDLRDFQTFNNNNNNNKEGEEGWTCNDPIPTYATEKTFNTIAKAMPYIVQQQQQQTNTIVTKRRVTVLERSLVIPEMAITHVSVPLPDSVAAPFPITFLPLYHGGDYISMGYVFGSKAKGTRVAYFSDVDRIPAITSAHLQEEGPNNIDIFIVDCLQKKTHFSHFGVEETWQAVVALQPRQVFCVGMFCELSYDDLNLFWEKRLEEQGHLTPRTEFIRTAYDGLELKLSLQN
eukprot:PhM_4_TR18736/c0_g1_i1/m.65812